MSSTPQMRITITVATTRDGIETTVTESKLLDVDRDPAWDREEVVHNVGLLSGSITQRFQGRGD